MGKIFIQTGLCRPQKPITGHSHYGLHNYVNLSCSPKYQFNWITQTFAGQVFAEWVVSCVTANTSFCWTASQTEWICWSYVDKCPLVRRFLFGREMSAHKVSGTLSFVSAYIVHFNWKLVLYFSINQNSTIALFIVLGVLSFFSFNTRKLSIRLYLDEK